MVRLPQTWDPLSADVRPMTQMDYRRWNFGVVRQAYTLESRPCGDLTGRALSRSSLSLALSSGTLPVEGTTHHARRGPVQSAE